MSNDFERLVDALIENLHGAEPPGVAAGRVHPPRAHARRGVAALLRKMGPLGRIEGMPVTAEALIDDILSQAPAELREPDGLEGQTIIDAG